MSRKQFGGWGWELSDREFGQALALLGVIAPYLKPGQRFPLGPQVIRRAIEKAANEWPAPPARVFDLGPLGGLDALRRGLHRQPALPLVRAWNTSGFDDGELELRPVRGLQNDFLFDILGGALAHSIPFFSLPEPAGQPRWTWPLRIGFAASDESLKSRLYDYQPSLSQSVAPLTEPVVGPNRCDVLLVESWSSRRLADVATMDLPEAALVVVLRSSDRREDPLRARAIARRANAGGVALVDAGSSDAQLEWLRTFLRELSHVNSIPTALRAAGRLEGLLAAPRLLSARPLADASRVLGAQMGMAAAMPDAEVIHVGMVPERTSAELGMTARAMPPTLSELEYHYARMAPRYESEGGGASHVAAVARAAAPAMAELEAQQAEERYIRADVRVAVRGDWVRRRRSFQAGARHRILVSIGPKDEEHLSGEAPIPHELLEQAAGHFLTIVLTEQVLLRRPLVGRVRLPRFGATRDVPFDLRVPRTATAVNARITVLHRGRILQTALLRGDVLAPAAARAREAAREPGDERGIEVKPEVDLRPGMAALDDRTRYHAAIVLNHDAAGTAGGTAMGASTAARLPLELAGPAVRKLGEILDAAEHDAAFNRKLGSAKSVTYLRKLALEGSKLYLSVGKEIQRVFPGTLERLQVLSADANTMLPVELIYDLAPPAAAVTLCAGATEALRTGRCTATHARNAIGQLEVVCPSGFWGVSKIVERVATRPDLVESGAFKVWSFPTPDADTLGSLLPVLFAASDRLNVVATNELDRVTAALEALTNHQVTRVDTWEAWAAALAVPTPPPMLVLLSHTDTDGQDGAALQIGAENSLAVPIGAITPEMVNRDERRPGPIVMLLGCTTGVPLDSFQSATVQFQQLKAALVIGTIAPVLGRHSSRMAEALLGALQDIQRTGRGRGGVPVGEALRDARRAMLGKGILMAMSIAAYGDADWRIPVEA